MRAVIQRVSKASVTVDGEVISRIGTGLLVLLGVEDADTPEDADWLVRKIIQLRIFADEQGLMNKSLQDVHGDLLVVSQFTLFASTKKGNRPSFIRSARPDHAIPLYEEFVQLAESLLGRQVATGSFGAMMEVDLVNSGPVTITIDTKNKE
ncbi:MAG TPA: D-aminoacyl-tRNA deacylase [Chitinophagales bacterium]|nr:D-aminoacyl-tRNA deacylase [Chitinophagales bacterium]HRX23827.1 D-aminoacyl-tRNA deacylase [Chitinophagales bacterium]